MYFFSLNISHNFFVFFPKKFNFFLFAPSRYFKMFIFLRNNMSYNMKYFASFNYFKYIYFFLLCKKENYSKTGTNKLKNIAIYQIHLINKWFSFSYKV